MSKKNKAKKCIKGNGTEPVPEQPKKEKLKLFDLKVEPFKDKKQLDERVAFLMAKGGVFRVENNDCYRIVLKTTKTPGESADLKEQLIWKQGKIPLRFYKKIVAFFDTFDSEVYAQIFWEKEKKEYYIYIPKQVVSGGSVEVERDWQRERRDVLALEVHSHNRMGCFFSGTDDRDEQRMCVYGVISFQGAKANSKWRVKCGDDQAEIVLDDIFVDEITKEPFPEEWTKNVTNRRSERSGNWDGGASGYGGTMAGAGRRYFNVGGVIVEKKQGDLFDEKDMPPATETLTPWWGDHTKRLAEEQKIIGRFEAMPHDEDVDVPEGQDIPQEPGGEN